MRLAFSIALRFLKSGKGQTFLIALGIAIGVSVQIFIGSLIQGLQADLVDTTIGSQSHITISSSADDGLIADYPRVMNEIKALNNGTKYVSAVVDGPALVIENDTNYNILVRGLSFEDSNGIYKIKDKIVEGQLPSGESDVLVGTLFSEASGLGTGDSFEVLAGFSEMVEVKISGIFDLRVANLNNSWVFTDINTAQTMFDYGDRATAIEMQVTDVFAADITADEIQKVVPGDLKLDNWKAQNAALLSGLNGQSISSYMIQAFVMVSVLLGIASVLAITVVQKSRQIGILKAMGIQDRAASQIFLIQGLLLGVAGALLGILLGLGLAFAFTTFALNTDGTPVVPLYINPSFIALSAGFAIVVSTGAALIPARSSSKLNPIEVIRNG